LVAAGRGVDRRAGAGRRFLSALPTRRLSRLLKGGK